MNYSNYLCRHRRWMIQIIEWFKLSIRFIVDEWLKLLCDEWLKLLLMND